jgi:hypothetical protein
VSRAVQQARRRLAQRRVRLWAAERLCGKLSGMPGYYGADEERARARAAVAEAEAAVEVPARAAA